MKDTPYQANRLLALLSKMFCSQSSGACAATIRSRVLSATTKSAASDGCPMPS